MTEPEPGSRRSTPVGAVVLTIVGSLVCLVALAVLAGGAAVAWADHTQRDADGYFTTGPHQFGSAGYAVTHEGTAIVGVPDAIDVGKLARIRIEGTGPRSLFLGIGRERDVSRYLSNVAHSQVSDFDVSPFRPHYAESAGTARPQPPLEESFWVASASGTPATLTWRVEEGRWSVVVMNADGSRGVVADLELGADIGYLGWIAGGVLLGGALLLGLGVLFIFIGVRRIDSGPRDDTAEEPAPHPVVGAGYPATITGRLDEPLSRGLWLLKWLMIIPHLFILVFLWAGFLAATVAAWFVILFTGRYPRGLFDFNLGVLRWSWRVSFYSYGALGTDRYPPFTLDPEPDYPATLHVVYPERPLSRKSTLFRLVLAFPHLLIVGVLTGSGGYWANHLDNWRVTTGGGLIGLLVLVVAVALLFTTRYPRGLFDLVLGLDRWVVRVGAYVALMTDEYPPFRLDQGGEESQAQSM